MGKTRFTEKQVTDALRLADSGEAVTRICRNVGVSRQAFYKWRSKFREIALKIRLRRLEKENHKLKQLITDIYLEKKVFSNRAFNEERYEHPKRDNLSRTMEQLREIDSCAFVPADH